MLEEFRLFIEAWRKIADSKGRGCIPSRDDVNIDSFGRFLRRSMIVYWDFDIPDLFIQFSGTDMKDFFILDERGSALRGFFDNPDMLARHAEVARRVTTDLLAAEMTSELTVADGSRMVFSQLRLPLEFENGYPTVIAFFHMEEFPREPTVKTQNAGVKIIEHRFIPLFDDEGLVDIETAPDFWFEPQRTVN